MDTQHWQVFEGQTVDGKYRLRQLLGHGAFGGVFLADETIGAQVIGHVAVKLILPSSANQQAQLNELVAMRNLNHPHVVRGLAAGLCTLNGFALLYLVMDVAEGTLEQRLKSGTVSTADAREIVRSIAEGLDFLHGRGMVHRDLKPGNVLRIGGQWQIADFGLIRAFGDDSAAYTQTVAGTPFFMPPESFRGTVSPAWDVWSLGVLLVVALTGQYPFTGASHHEVAEAIMHQEPHLAARLPAPFDAIVRGCLVKDRKARWTARQVLDALTPKPVSVPVTPRQPTATPSQTTRPQPTGLGTQPTMPAAPTKRPAVPAGFWGLGGLLLGGIVVANMVSSNKPSASPTTATLPAHYSSHAAPPMRSSAQRVTKTRAIPYPIKRVKTASLLAGQTQVQQKGHPGEMSVAYDVRTRNGHVSRHVVSRTIAKAPVPEILLVGSRHTTSSPTPQETRVASAAPSPHRSVMVAAAPRPHSQMRHAVVAYHHTARSSVGDLHSQSSIGNSSWHGSSNTASSDTSDSLH